MLEFKLKNRPFLLDESTSIRITWFNPACFFDKIEGDVAMGIQIPENDNNRAMLGNPERFERDTKTDDQEFEGFEVRYSGVLYISGTLIINGYAGKTYTGWTRSNVGNLGKQHREKFIYDIAAFNQNISFTNKANYDPDSDHYGCPRIMNELFFKDKGGRREFYRLSVNPDWWPGSQENQFSYEPYESEVLSEGFRHSNYSYVNQLNPDNTVKLGIVPFASPDLLYLNDITVVSPMLFLNYIIKAILKDAHYYINNNALADNDDLKKLILYNNFDITKMGFTTIGELPFNSPFANLNGIKAHSFKIDFAYRNYTDTFKYKDLLPKVQLKDFILSIQNLLNVCFLFRSDGRVDIIDREEILKGPAIDINKYMIGNWEKGEKKDVTLKFKFSHDDADLIFKDRWEDIDDRRDDEKEPVDTWDDLDLIEDPEIGEVRYLQTLNIYVEYAWTQKVNIDQKTGKEINEDILGWKFLAAGFQNGFFNRGRDQEETIETKFSTLYSSSPGSIYPPAVQQPGNMKSMKFAYKSFSPRLIFYNGNNQCEFTTENISIDWERPETGLLATRWPVWNRFWSTRLPVSRQADLPLNVIDYIRRNITSKFRSREGEFIIQEMETEFGLNKIGDTKLKGYKV
jgi:hypothetical protein